MYDFFLLHCRSIQNDLIRTHSGGDKAITYYLLTILFERLINWLTNSSNLIKEMENEDKQRHDEKVLEGTGGLSGKTFLLYLPILLICKHDKLLPGGLNMSSSKTIRALFWS